MNTRPKFTGNIGDKPIANGIKGGIANNNCPRPFRNHLNSSSISEKASQGGHKSGDTHFGHKEAGHKP